MGKKQRAAQSRPVLATQNWAALTATHDEQGIPPCPIEFDRAEAKACLKTDLELMDIDAQIADLRGRFGIGSDGWIPAEEFDEAVAKNNQVLKNLLNLAEDDRDLDLTLRHYPFVDHDEDE
jgi:hypothetical protein